MSRVPDHIVADIRDRVSIKDVVQDYVSLKKDGANHKGLCPFHNEKTPSFKIHEGKGIYKCFGCGEAGNVFGFLMKIENMSFGEALERLAARAGIELPKKELTPEEKEKVRDRARLFNANEKAAAFYHECLLKSPQAEAAREYLKGRGYGRDTAERFHLGYAPPGWENLVPNLASKGVKTEDLHGAGLLIESDRGGYYDRFRGRLMFPIMDVQGRTLGFGARRMDDDPNSPKYINSPETEIYRKGRGFYGLYQAKDHIRKNGRALVVEGYFDQIALYEKGLMYAVATLGTALTVEHARMMRRYAEDVFLVFDADEAGQRAAIRSLESFLDAGVSPRIVVVPSGKDPDDYMSEHGKDEFEVLLDAAPPLLTYYMDDLLASAEENPARMAKAVGDAAAMVARVQDPIERSMYSDLLSRKSGVPLPKVEAKLRRPERAADAPSANNGAMVLDKDLYPKGEQDLVRILVHHPETAEKVREAGAVGTFQNHELKTLAETILAQLESDVKTDPSLFLQKIEDNSLQQWISCVIFEDDPFGDVVSKALADVIRHLSRSEIDAKLARLRREMEEAHKSGDEGMWRALLEKQQSLLSAQKEIANLS